MVLIRCGCRWRCVRSPSTCRPGAARVPTQVCLVTGPQGQALSPGDFSVEFRPALQPLVQQGSSPNYTLGHMGHFFFLRFHLFTFRERGSEGEREGEKHQCARETSIGCLSCIPTGDLAHNPGMCPDWESNQRLFGSQVITRSTEPHQPGRFLKCSFPGPLPCLQMQLQLV